MANGYWTSHGQLTEAELAAVQLAVANGIATYAAGEIEKLAGVPATLTDLLALAEVNCYPRPFTLYAQGGHGPCTQAAATWTSPNASDNGSGKLRMTTTGDSDGVHGLTTVGQKLYITFATTGSGLHEIATVVDTKTIDFTTSYAAVSGAPTVYPIGTDSPMMDICTVDGGTMGPNGSLDVSVMLQCTVAATNKYIALYLGGEIAGNTTISGAADAGWHLFGHIANMNSETVQICAPLKSMAATGFTGATVDTTADAVLSMVYKVPAADSFISFDHVRATLTPGV